MEERSLLYLDFTTQMQICLKKCTQETKQSFNCQKWLLDEVGLAKMANQPKWLIGRSGWKKWLLGKVAIGQSGYWAKWDWPKWLLVEVAIGQSGFGMNEVGLDEVAIGRTGHQTKWVWPNWLLEEVGLAMSGLSSHK